MSTFRRKRGDESAGYTERQSRTFRQILEEMARNPILLVWWIMFAERCGHKEFDLSFVTSLDGIRQGSATNRNGAVWFSKF